MDKFSEIVKLAHDAGYVVNMRFSENNSDGGKWATCDVSVHNDKQDGVSFSQIGNDYTDVLKKVHRRLAFYLTFPDTKLDE